MQSTISRISDDATTVSAVRRSTLGEPQRAPKHEVDQEAGRRSGKFAWVAPLRARLQRAMASRMLVYPIFTVLYLIPSLILASMKLFWDDEFFTLYLARVSGWHDLLRALGTGADQHPPSFYYLTHGVITALGTSHVTVRLPEIFGYWLLCVTLYEIVRLFAPPMWAVVGMLFPLTTNLYLYATEARAYGLVCGFGALAVLAWMRSTVRQKRTADLVLLGFCLAAAVASHYYAVMIALCLGIGELVRTVKRRKIDFPIWIAFLFTATPLLIFLRVIRSARGYSTHFWAIPAWTDWIRFYAVELGLGVLGVVGSAVLLSSFSGTFRRRGQGDPALTRSLPLEWAVGLSALAFLPLLVTILAKFVTHGFSDRYTIGAIVGIAALVAFFLSRYTPAFRYAGLAIFVSLVLFWFQFHELDDSYTMARQTTAHDLENLSGTGDQTIATMDVTKFHRLSFYAPRSLASRLVFIADPADSILFLGHDTVDRGLLDLRPWFPLQVVPTRDFLATHQDFLIYGTITKWSWLSFRMPEWGEARLLGRDQRTSVLFSMHRTLDVGAPTVSPDRGTENLYDTLPRTGPSLCTLYMGASHCRMDNPR